MDADPPADPYPPDQQFGAAAAEDQERAERMAAQEEPLPEEAERQVRAANKAEPAE